MKITDLKQPDTWLRLQLPTVTENSMVRLELRINKESFYDEWEREQHIKEMQRKAGHEDVAENALLKNLSSHHNTDTLLMAGEVQCNVNEPGEFSSGVIDMISPAGKV